MPAFRVSGSTGQAPTTSWMGAIPDRGFTLLRPTHYISSGNSIQIDSFGPANYVNLLTPYNLNVDTGSGTNAATVSVGATVTAPDGTSSGTASHITEAATTGNHAMIALGLNGGLPQFGGWSMRFAVIAKAAERTRIALAMNSGSTIGVGSGCITVFDLAGVQIGVANTAFNSFGGYPDAVPGATSISSLGGGWCLCMMDVYYPFRQNLFGGLWGSFSIDSGSGTGAKSISYAGNGTSGVYAWRAIMLPPAAWAMSGTEIFRSDFDSINEIDVNNTKAAGYKWYTNNLFPGGGFNSDYHPAVVPTPSDQIAVGSSVLTLQQADGQFLQAQLMSAASIGDNTNMGIVGNSFNPPFLYEIKSSFDNINTGASSYDQWALGQGTLGVGPHPFTGIEMNFGGIIDTYNMSGSLWTWIIGTDNTAPQTGPYFSYAPFSQYVGYAAWDATANYEGNSLDVVGYNGVAYSCLTFPPTNNINLIPPDNPASWGVISNTTTNITSYNFIDYKVMNVYSTLVLPTPHNDSGWFINFMNGAACGPTPSTQIAGSTIAFNPFSSGLGNDGGGYYQHWDTDGMILILFAGSGTGNPAQIDYVSVVQ